MANHRMTRATFDAVVHERMKRYRVSIDKATSLTLRELEGPPPARRPESDIDRPYREKRRYPTHDPPRGFSDRSRDMEMRRDGNQSYLHEQEREPSGGRNVNLFSDRWSSSDSYREQLNSKKRRLDDLENPRSIEREDYVPRDLSRRSWDFDRPLRGPDRDFGRSDVYGDSRPPSLTELDPVKDLFRPQGSMGSVFRPQGSMGSVFRPQGSMGSVLRPQGSMGSVPMRRREKKGPQQQSLSHRPGKPSEAFPSNKSGNFYNMCIMKWAEFNTIENDLRILHRGMLKENTSTCQMTVDCFKRGMTNYSKYMCFSSVKPLTIAALRNPKIDTDLLDLLVRNGTVAVKNDFFEVIRPFDLPMLTIQLRLLKCATPLMLASCMFELKQTHLTDPKKLMGALRSTVLQCQRAIVLIGQTFASITSSRRAKILDVLGVNAPGLKPSDYPNVKNCHLFGAAFINKLKEWLKDKDNKLVLKKPANLVAESYVVKEEDLETEAESQERKAADPKVVAAIDELLKNAKKGNADGEKSEFWFLFDEGSNEYKYYRQKFEEFQKSKGGIGANGSQNRTCGRSPEDLACESVRAMRYARKVQALKRKLRRSLAFSRKRKEVKLRRCAPKAAPPVKVEEGTEEEQQQLELAPTEIKEEVEVKPQIAPDKCSTSDSTEAKKDAASPVEKEPADAPAGEVDEKTKDTAIKLAQFVAQMGPEIEKFSKENSVNNPEFWFLCDKESPAYKFYRSKVEELKQAEEEDATSDDGDIGLDDDDLENIRTGDEPQNDSDLELDAECEAAEAPSAETTPVAAFAQMPTPARPPIARKRVSNLKVGMLPPKRVCLVEEPKQHDPVRIEYDRPRGRGNNRRRKPADLEFADKKINQQNVGFQMLSKMGWRDGQGLGPGGSGIKNPVNVGTVSAGEGLGADEKKAGKSANFDAFRQRMIQMYRKLPSNKAQKD